LVSAIEFRPPKITSNGNQLDQRGQPEEESGSICGGQIPNAIPLRLSRLRVVKTPKAGQMFRFADPNPANVR
jgi:hypothetical protein